MTQEFKIKDVKIPNRLILAPMCGITLLPFRKICKQNKAGLVFNQMVSAKALTMKDKKSFHLMKFEEQERPIGLQVFGRDADTLAEASAIMDTYKPDVIDLNLGCPARKIVHGGGGSALMGDTVKLRTILKKMRAQISGAFTIKIRAGWDDKNRNAFDVAKLAEDEGIDAIALHARTRAQGYSGKSDWNLIKELKNEVKSIPIIGNGDVKNYHDVKRMILETGCDAVMTARGAFEQPWIFKNFVEDSDEAPSVQKRKELVLKQYEYAIAYHGEHTGIKMMRKHLCAYTKGIRGGAEFRNRIVRINDYQDIQNEVKDFFA